MPAPSQWPTRLADDLVIVGQKCGFKAKKEQPPSSNSLMKIDVVWKLRFPALKESKLPEIMPIVSIEIQYSKSDSSVSHGLVKGQYANSPYHIIICSYVLNEDYKSALKTIKPQGLIIIDSTNLADFRLWIDYMLIQEKHLNNITKRTVEKIKQLSSEGNRDLNIVRGFLDNEIGLLFVPKEITFMLNTFSEYDIEDDKSTVQNVFEEFNIFIQQFFKKHYFVMPFLFDVSKVISDCIIGDSKNLSFVFSLKGIEIMWINKKYPFSFDGIYFEVANENQILASAYVQPKKIKFFVFEIMKRLKKEIDEYVPTEEEKREFSQILDIFKKSDLKL